MDTSKNQKRKRIRSARVLMIVAAFGFMGAGIGKRVTLNGSFAFHYDEKLEDNEWTSDPSLELANWRELAARSDRIDFDNYPSGP